jgi:hypothetical protein
MIECQHSDQCSKLLSFASGSGSKCRPYMYSKLCRHMTYPTCTLRSASPSLNTHQITRFHTRFQTHCGPYSSACRTPCSTCVRWHVIAQASWRCMPRECSITLHQVGTAREANTEQFLHQQPVDRIDDRCCVHCTVILTKFMTRVRAVYSRLLHVRTLIVFGNDDTYSCNHTHITYT